MNINSIPYIFLHEITDRMNTTKYKPSNTRDAIQMILAFCIKLWSKGQYVRDILLVNGRVIDCLNMVEVFESIVIVMYRSDELVLI